MRSALVVRNDEFIRRSSTARGRIGLRCTWGVGAQKLTPLPLPLSTTVLKCLDLRSERIDYSVHGSSRALHCAMRHILRRNRGALRHVPRCARRSRLNARGGNGEGKND
jgi:hypothetical protein